MKLISENPLGKLLEFISIIEKNNIFYRLEHVRDSIMVVMVVPGEYWEVEFFEDGSIEVERFVSSEGVRGEDYLNAEIDQLFE
jgi:hypothetical protein